MSERPTPAETSVVVKPEEAKQEEPKAAPVANAS